MAQYVFFFFGGGGILKWEYTWYDETLDSNPRVWHAAHGGLAVNRQRSSCLLLVIRRAEGHLKHQMEEYRIFERCEPNRTTKMSKLKNGTSNPTLT